jgi:uncharacterized protein (TIGR00730 family)
MASIAAVTTVPLRICVYCASSEAVAPEHRAAAAELGRAIADRGWSLVYGGGSIGLMGEVARAALAAGAHVTGVIPHRLAEREVALEAVSELIRTETMRERKAIMDDRADAFVVLPGGVGTLEELVEILSLKQLGYHDRAIVILDSAGYWDPLLGQLRRMVDERLAGEALLGLFDVTTNVAETVAALAAYRPISGRGAAEADVALEATDVPPRS